MLEVVEGLIAVSGFVVMVIGLNKMFSEVGPSLRGSLYTICGSITYGFMVGRLTVSLFGV